MNTNGIVGRFVLSDITQSDLRSLLSLIVGLIVGFCIAELFVLSIPNRPDWLLYRSHLQSAYYSHEIVGVESFIEHFDEYHEHAFQDTSMAGKLFNETRVLCWIMTNPNNHQIKARHVLRTWGKRCNKLIFMSSQVDKELDAVALNVSEGRNNLWAKTKKAFKYIYKHHFDDADWFYKADDDTYAIMENLRYMLYPYSPETPIYFGCKFKPFVKQGYMSGGAGYVLSKEAVRRFVVEGIPDPKKCRQDNDGAEDVEIGKCLENVNVIAGDSRDSNARARFFPLKFEHHLIPSDLKKTSWFWKYTYFRADMGVHFCSDYPVSFHYVPPTLMYTMDYLIYHLRLYGVINLPERLPERLKVGQTFAPPVMSISNNSGTTENALDKKENITKN